MLKIIPNVEHQAWIENTKQKIAVGIAELDRGEGIDGPTIMNQYLQQFQAEKQSKQDGSNENTQRNRL